MEAEKNKSLLKQIVELIELIIVYIRQQTKMTIEKSVSEPIKKAGQKAAAAVLASFLLGIAAIFIAVGLFQLLAVIVGATWIAYLIIGGLLVIFGIVIASRLGNDGKKE